MRARVLMALAIGGRRAGAVHRRDRGAGFGHVLKTVGPYHLLIGFGNEPTYAGAQNSVFLLLTTRRPAHRSSMKGSAIR